MPIDSYVNINSIAGTVLGAGTSGGGDISLAALMQPMTAVHPAVDSTNGPLTADTHIVAGSPSTTNRVLYRWDSGVFRTQGMKWEAANTAANTSGQSAAINNSTPRKYTYGTSNGQPYESNHDFAFVTDSTSVTIWYWHWNGYTSSNYHDIRHFVEYNDRLHHLRDSGGKAMPKTSTGGGGFFYETLTFSEARERQHRVMLPSNCFFIGVYVDTLAMIRPAAKTVAIAHNGDSWGEPNGNVLASPIGGAFPTGTFRTMGLAQELAVQTGFVVALIAQGGTGEFNVNDGTARLPTYTNAVGESTFEGQARIDDAFTKFGSIIYGTIGGWNDGDLAGAGAAATTAYQARVQDGINRWKAKNANIKLFYASIQPVGSGTTLDANRAASLQGQKAAALANPTNVIGFIDYTTMWPNVSTSGQRGANVNSADTIHLHSKGANGVAGWMVQSLRQFVIPLSYYNAMIA